MSNVEHREWLRKNLGINHPALGRANASGGHASSGANPTATRSSSASNPSAASPAQARAPLRPGSAPVPGSGRPAASRHQNVTEYTFGDDEADVVEVPVAPIGVQNNSGEQEIERYMGKVKEGITQIMRSFDRALAKFAKTIEGASEQETVPQGAQAVVKSLTKSAFDAAIDQAVKRIPGIGEAASHLVGPIKGAIEAYIAEIERASNAAERLQTRRFITDLITIIDARERTMLASVDTVQTQMRGEFRSRSGPGEAQRDVARGAVVGAAADCVNLAKQLAQEFADRASRYDLNYFHQQITLGFVNTPGYTQGGHAMRGAREAGMLWFQLQLRLKGGFPNNCQWEIQNSASAWTLVTLRSSHDAQTAADSLRESFGNTRPWQIPLPHKVIIRIRADDRGLAGEGNIKFENPGEFEQPTFDAFSVPMNVLRAAWADPQVRKKVQDITAIQGSNE